MAEDTNRRLVIKDLRDEVDKLRVNLQVSITNLMDEYKLQLITPEEYRENKKQLTAKTDADIAALTEEIKELQSTLRPQNAHVSSSSQRSTSSASQVLDDDDTVA